MGRQKDEKKKAVRRNRSKESQNFLATEAFSRSLTRSFLNLDTDHCRNQTLRNRRPRILIFAHGRTASLAFFQQFCTHPKQRNDHDCERIWHGW